MGDFQRPLTIKDAAGIRQQIDPCVHSNKVRQKQRGFQHGQIAHGESDRLGVWPALGESGCGKAFGGIVGQSESNLRSAIAMVEAIAPCVLWLDEIEKGFSGAKSSGASDGGTASRVLGTFLAWMQDRTAPVFVVATANDVLQLPPEMLRKGRFDELFFVDLPSKEEREVIWRIQIARYGRKPDAFDTERLAAATGGWTGAEIEPAFVDALYDAFAKREEPTDLSVMLLLNQAVPLSRLMSDQIEGLRSWAKGRARRAGAAEAEPLGRRILPKN